jgi:hypothetical protein
MWLNLRGRGSDYRRRTNLDQQNLVNTIVSGYCISRLDAWVQSTSPAFTMAPQATTNTEAAKVPASVTNSKRKYTWQGGGGRRRVSQACDQCRSKKLKRDGAYPACLSCSSLGRECSYGSVVKRRGMPEGYARGLERLVALIILDRHGQGSVATTFGRTLNNEAAKRDLIQQWNG